MLITANSIVNNVGISKLSFPLWEYMLLAEEKKGGSVVCVNEVLINILTDFILSIRFCDIITQHARKVVSDSPG